MSAEEATVLLESHGGDVSVAILYCAKQQKKFQKQVKKATKGKGGGDEAREGKKTPGYVEMNTMAKQETNVTAGGDAEEEEATIKGGFCCGR